MTDADLQELTVIRAQAPDGSEWVPLEVYKRMEAELETLRCQVVNPYRNVHRALKRLRDQDPQALYFLEEAASQIDVAYETAFPRKGRA